MIRTIINEKDIMRKLFFGILTALILAACSSDPVYHGMTPQQKEDYSKAIAGEYTGTYIIIYNSGLNDAKAVKVENSQMTITDQTMHSVCFHNYPVISPAIMKRERNGRRLKAPVGIAIVLHVVEMIVCLKVHIGCAGQSFSQCRISHNVGE